MIKDFNFEKYAVVICVSLSIVFFSIDMSIPLGVAAGVPYICVILCACFARKTKVIFYFGILTTVLTLIGYVTSEENGILWMVISNRALAIMAIWVTVVLGTIIKNSKIRQAESVEKFHLLTSQSPLMMWQANTDGNWYFVSNGWLNFSGRKSHQEVNDGWIENIHPEDLDLVQRTYRELIENNKSFQISCRLKNKAGHHRWISFQGNTCYTAGGEVSGFLGTALDIHERKETESTLENLRQSYYLQEKMASIGTLTSGILHEISNPLASVSGLLNEVKNVFEKETFTENDRSVIDNYLAMTFTEVNRLIGITQDVNKFAQISLMHDAQLVDLNSIIESTYILLQHDERMWRVKFKTELDNNLPAVHIAAGSLSQIIQNLITNALDALDGKQSDSEITVKTYTKDDNIIVSIKDNGAGMTDALLAQVGQEFFTTKELGTGLGLFLCYSFINNMGGDIKIYSKEGEGTEVVISLSKAP